MTEDERSFAEITGGIEVSEESKLLTEYSEHLAWLNKEGLGRALIRRQSAQGETIVTRTDGDTGGDFSIRKQPDQTQETFLGYVLPLTNDDAEQPEHLVCFADGTMVHTKKSYDATNSFSPSESPLTVHDDIEKTKNNLITNNYPFSNRRTIGRNNAGNETVFASLFEKAVTVAKERKALQEKTRLASMEIFNRSIAAMREQMKPKDPPKN